MKITLSECSFNDKKIAAEWNGIYRSNPQLGYFASYEFNEFFVRCFHKNKSRRSMKLVIIRAFDEQRGALMFLPLAKSHGHYYMIWERSSVPYCDAIYRADISKDEFDYILDHLSEIVGNETIFFTKMNELSVFTQYLHDRFTPYKKRSCGSIELLRSYNYTYQLLSKECRENIEDSKEKIINEGLVYRTDFYSDKPLSAKAAADIEMIVHGEGAGVFTRIKNSASNRNSAIFQAVKKGVSSLVALSYIDDYPVACTYGFIKGNTFTISVLSSTRYGVSYSSKHLILCDLIKYAVENKNLSKIDLCRLDDNIKGDFVSKKHHVYGFEVKL